MELVLFCCWWTAEFSETCRVSCQNKFVKLVLMVGFIIKKFVKIHGHTNVKFPKKFVKIVLLKLTTWSNYVSVTFPLLAFSKYRPSEEIITKGGTCKSYHNLSKYLWLRETRRKKNNIRAFMLEFGSEITQYVYALANMISKGCCS